jgi:hypothetical protein
VTTFVSPVPDPRAYAVAAMSLSWEGMFAYAFPPFRFLAPVLHKITGEKCRIIVIAPAWPKQAWFANYTASVLCQATSASLKTKSSISVQRGCGSSFYRKTPSTRLVSVGDNLRYKGFSETATKHISRSVQESTSIVYDAKWTIFSDWCVGREIDPFKISPTISRFSCLPL